MPNFVEDNTGLNFPKFDLNPLPGGADATKHIAAADWNTTCQAAIDVKGVLRGAKWLGWTPQATRPVVPGVAAFVWVNTADQVVLTVAGVDHVLGEGDVLATRQISTGFGLSGGGDLSANRTLRTRLEPYGYISAKDPLYGAVGDGVTDDRAALQAAIANAVALNCVLKLPAGVYNVSRTPGTFHSLILQGVSNLRIEGVPGETWIRHPDAAADVNALCVMLRISGCVNIELDGIGFNGNWGNAVVRVVAENTGFPSFLDLAALPSNELPYEGDGTNFPASGSLKIVTKTGPQILTYTGKTASKFTGVSAGTGITQAGDLIGLIDKAQKTGTVAAGSNGVDIAAIGTLNVASTAGFPNSVASDGLIQVQTASGFRSFRYTSKNATQFLGISNASGAGVLSTGFAVQYVDGAGNQFGSPMQVDPKNHAIFCYGSDGVTRTPNRNITISRCLFRDVYGDHVWIGAWSENVTLIGCEGDISARNGVTLSNFAEGVTIYNCGFDNIFTSAVDSEPVDGPVRDIVIDSCRLGMWWNPAHDTGGNITLSLQGGVVGRQAEWNYIRNVQVTNTRVRGGTLISDAKDVTIENCELLCDFGGTTTAPVTLLMLCEGVTIDNNRVYSALTPSNRQFNWGAINVSAYRMSVNTAAQPANVVIKRNRIAARNGTMGIYTEATGGYPGVEGTATSYTPPSAGVPGEIQVAGSPWSSQIDYFIGHQVLMGGKIANVIGNDSNTLFISPLFEAYATGIAWADHRGRQTSAPPPGAFKVLATGGRVHLEHNLIDCRDVDGKGAGGYGISIATSSTWEFGYNDSRVVIEKNDIRGANGRAINCNVQDGTAPFREIQVVGNHAWDDQTTPTCTHHVYFSNAADITDRVMHGNTQEGAIVPVTGLTTGIWRQSDSYPGSWAGYEDPNGLIAAPPGATYNYIAANSLCLKESGEEFNTGWNPMKTGLRAGIRAIGTPVSGTGALNLAGAMPASVVGDLELLLLSTTYVSAAGSDATLSTPAGFVKKVSNTSNYGPNTIVNRAAIWWRRKKPGDAAPVVADSGDHNEAIVVAVKDAVGFGDPFDFSPVGSQNNTTSTPPITATLTGGTVVTDGSLFMNLLTWFSSGATNHVDGWTNADTDLTEAVEVIDAGVVAGGERIGIALYAGRVETAAAVGSTTVNHNAENYAVWSGITFGIRPAQAPARATGLITCTTKANYVDTDYMTLGDGMMPAREFEFDTAGNGVTSGRVQVNISGATTAADVATILRTAIVNTFPALEITDNADGTLRVEHRWPGVAGNVTITESVANAGHLVSGMSGGAG